MTDQTVAGLLAGFAAPSAAGDKISAPTRQAAIKRALLALFAGGGEAAAQPQKSAAAS